MHTKTDSELPISTISDDSPRPEPVLNLGDYQCPHCGRAYPIIKRIQSALGDSLKFVFRNFPLSEAHPQAFIAVVAAEAAGKQKAYWEMHDMIFENQALLERLPFGDLRRNWDWIR